MEPNSRANLGYKLRRARTDAPKVEVIVGEPDEKLPNIQYIYKNLRQRTKLVGSKTKQHTTKEKRRTGGGVGKHEGLKPG